jgi:hypothetical protein
MDIQILLALQQARAGDRASTLPLLLASSYSVTASPGYTGRPPSWRRSVRGNP